MPRPYLLDMPTCREEFDVPLVARAMSHLNRYAGKGEFPISDATHCYVLSFAVPRHLRRAALMHDTSEIWFGDVPAGVKRECPDYQAKETAYLHKIFGWFAIPGSHLVELHPYDVAIRNDEMRCAFSAYDRSHRDPEEIEGLGVSFAPTDPLVAERNWLGRYVELFG